MPITLYQLSNNEIKFSPPTEEEQSRCHSQTLLDSPQWEPYPTRTCQVENLCGKFLLCLSSTRTSGGAVSLNGPPDLDEALAPVSFKINSPFGTQTEIYSLHGHITHRVTPGLPKTLIFKGLAGDRSIHHLKSDLLLSRDTAAAVHMGVVSCFLGKRVQTSAGCYLENKVNLTVPWLKVDSRCLDQENVVRLSVIYWGGLLPDTMYHPLTNDIVITGKGSFLHRLTWGALVWDKDVEDIILAGVGRAADFIKGLV